MLVPLHPAAADMLLPARWDPLLLIHALPIACGSALIAHKASHVPTFAAPRSPSSPGHPLDRCVIICLCVFARTCVSAGGQAGWRANGGGLLHGSRSGMRVQVWAWLYEGFGVGGGCGSKVLQGGEGQDLGGRGLEWGRGEVGVWVGVAWRVVGVRVG